MWVEWRREGVSDSSSASYWLLRGTQLPHWLDPSDAASVWEDGGKRYFRSSIYYKLINVTFTLEEEKVESS